MEPLEAADSSRDYVVRCDTPTAAIRSRVELSSISIVHMAAGYLTEERPLICGVFYRRICDIVIFRGNVVLLRAPQRKCIPEKVPSDRPTRFASVPPVGKPRDPNVRIYVDNDRFRIVHEHKRNGRGPLAQIIHDQPGDTGGGMVEVPYR